MDSGLYRFPPDFEQRYARLSPGEQMRVRELMKRFKERAAANPIELYEPHPKQHDLHAAIGTPIRGFMGGNRSGKTTAGLLDDLMQAAPADLLPDRLRPYKRFECPFYCRIMTTDFVSTMQPVIIEKLRQWTPRPMLRDGMFDSSYSKADRALRFECGCRFDFMTYEQSLDKFGGSALHRCHYDEEPPEDIRKECLMRLGDFNGDELFTMTPLQGMTWMYDGIYERRGIDPNVHIVVADIDDNPHLDADAIARILAEFTDEELEARKSGKFVHFGGLVYRRWDDAEIAAPAKESVLALPDVVCSIDPGIRVTAVAWVGFDRDNRAILFDELYLKDMNVDEVVQAIRRREREWDFQVPVHYVIDPNARVRDITRGVTIIAEYNNCGLYPNPGQNDVAAGIAIIRRRIKNGDFVWTSNCVNAAWEAHRYRIEPDENDDDKVVVIKVDDHLMDAVRYAIMERPYDMKIRDAARPPNPDHDIAFPREQTVAHRPGESAQEAATI